MVHCCITTCKERYGKLPECTNRDCSVSAEPGEYLLSEMVSKIVITPNCSSEIVRHLDQFMLKPSLWNLDGKWQKARRN